MRELIAVVDDEPDIQELVSLHLQKAQFSVRTFGDAASFFRFADTLVPDLIVLDLMLPDMDGFDICRRIRETEILSGIPVIMLTARGEETDKVAGLEIGADDYVTKPFSPKELVARVKAVLRRRNPDGKGRAMTIGGILRIDPDRYSVTVDGGPVQVTSTEFRILQLLSRRPGWVYARDQILESLWGQDKIVIDRTVDVHIKHLREKLGAAGVFIKNVRGVGYKLEP